MAGTDLTPYTSTSAAVAQARPPRGNILGTLALIVPTAIGGAMAAAIAEPMAMVAGAAVGLVAMFAPKIASQWERAVVLKWGRYDGVRGPGVFWVIPGIHTVAAWIDHRTVATSFAAEQTLTMD